MVWKATKSIWTIHSQTQGEWLLTSHKTVLAELKLLGRQAALGILVSSSLQTLSTAEPSDQLWGWPCCGHSQGSPNNPEWFFRSLETFHRQQNTYIIHTGAKRCLRGSATLVGWSETRRYLKWPGQTPQDNGARSEEWPHLLLLGKSCSSVVSRLIQPDITGLK